MNTTILVFCLPSNKKENRKKETACYTILYGNIKEIQFLHKEKKKKKNLITYVRGVPSTEA